MPCNRVLVVAAGAILWLITATSIWATPSGSAEEARALLDKAIAAVRADKLKALEMFNSGAGGSRIAISMCLAPMPPTELSQRIRPGKVHSSGT